MTGTAGRGGPGAIILALLIVVTGSALTYSCGAGDKGRYDPYTYLYARTNVDFLRSAIAAYAADSDAGLYPLGAYDYGQIQRLFPDVSFPGDPEDAGWLEGSFQYLSHNGHSFTVSVLVNDREKAAITGLPHGLIEEYMHPMAGGKAPQHLRDGKLRVKRKEKG